MTAALELDRWSDDGGPVPVEPLPPLIVTLTLDTSRFWAEMTAAMTGFGLAIREASEAVAAGFRAFADSFDSDEAAMWARLYERPVDRARRLRLDRQLRIVARRADRRARIAARHR